MQILYWLHKSRANKAGLAPLKIRITCGPKDSVEIVTGKFVDPELWDTGKKRVSGKSTQAEIVNKYIIASEAKLQRIESDLDRDETPYNAEIVRNIFKGNHIQRYTLLQVLDIHNDLWRQKLGQKGFSADVLKKYTGLKNKLEYFMDTKYKRKDLFMSELTLDFIESFWHFLTTKGKEVRGVFAEPLDPESACGIITRLKKIAKMGFKKQLIHVNPFDEFKATFNKSPKEPLTMEQVKAVMDHDFKNKRLERVKDRFIIGCFTGLSNEDLQTVTYDMITTDMNGQKWINKDRVKTGELSMIPIWPPVAEIIEKYKNDPELVRLNRLFPQISLQKMNSYLEEIADVCGVNRKITTHDCRRYYADIYLNSGGDLETLARLLGHSTTITTRRYARRNKATIMKETNLVKDVIFGRMEDIKNRKIG